MRRFSVVLVAVSAVAVTACTSQPRGTEMPEQAQQVDTQAVVPGGPITVNVFCNDIGPGIGARVHPWRAHTGEVKQVTWHIVPANQGISGTLEPVDSARWPFQQQSYSSDGDSIVAQLTAEPDTGAYPYRLTLACPTDTIVIDPIVIVDQ